MCSRFRKIKQQIFFQVHTTKKPTSLDVYGSIQNVLWDMADNLLTIGSFWPHPPPSGLKLFIHACTIKATHSLCGHNNSIDLKHQRSYQRWLSKRIDKTELKFWAVGAAEKKNLPTAISMQLFGVVFFQLFVGKKIIQIFLKNILASALKSYII